MIIDAQGCVTAQDAQGNIVIQAALTPVADASYLYGGQGQLADHCNGLFTFRISTKSSQQDVFVTFMGRAVLFSSFTWKQRPLTCNDSNPPMIQRFNFASRSPRD